jgi:hypothetical protein
MLATSKIYKENGTPVFVHFGLELQRVLLTINDWEEELKEIWAAHIKLDTSGVYELSIDHGISCDCCTKIVHEPYTHPTLATRRQERHPGRPRLKARR